jgi:phosphoglycolate phosphatase-like HAD superfamily hydrolase
MDNNDQAISGVLWDMDGVLADTGELHFQSWVMALSEVGIPFDRKKFRQTFGMNNKGILSILLGHPPEPSFLANVSDRKESLFRQMIRGKVHPMPGVQTWLERLQSMDYRQAVASSATIASIDALVDEMQIRSYFSAIVSAYSTTGLSLGITTGLNIIGRMVIILTMFAGRLGAITIMISLMGRDRGEKLVDYPEESILIG